MQMASTVPHNVTEDWLLRRLLWKPGNEGSQLQVQEGRAPAVVPDAATALQWKLCKQFHSESGHASYLKAHRMLAERYIWTGMSGQIIQVAKTCNQCDYFGDKRPKAPVTGHVTASEPAERIMMDVVHMKEAEGYQICTDTHRCLQQMGNGNTAAEHLSRKQ